MTEPSLDDDTEDSVPIDKQKLEKLDVRISQPPSGPSELGEIEYYSFRSGAAPHIGYLMDLRAKDKSKSGATLGITYLLPDRRMPQWEFGAELLFSGGGLLSATRRTTINPTNFLRPFYKWGVALNPETDEGIASLVQFNNILLTGGAGIEKFYRSPLSFRAEINLYGGLSKLFVHTSLGFNWAW